MGMSLTTAPTREPVTLTEAKTHLRIDHSEEDGTLAGYILAARHHIEGATRRALSPQTWELTLDHFPPVIELPMPPLVSVVSVKYVDRDGAVQTLDPALYVVENDGPRGLIFPAYQQRWPEVRHHGIAVIVEFECGYEQVPPDLKHAILLLTAHFYEIRQPAIVGTSIGRVPMSVDALISPYAVVGF